MFAFARSARALWGCALLLITAPLYSQSLGVYPSSTAVRAGSQQVFQAQLFSPTSSDSYTADTHPLVYAVDGQRWGNSSVGTISTSGLYTAPGAPASHTVTVTDTTLNKSATSSVTVFSSVYVDFGSRTSSHAVPSHLFAAEHVDTVDQAAPSELNVVSAGGVTVARFYALIPLVFKTKTPNWNYIDAPVRRITQAGFHIMLQMNQTPPWLQPAGKPCGSTAYTQAGAMPTDVNAWGQMAAQYVHHMDATFPGMVTEYEIWNEPNSGGLCVPPANRLADYMAIYRAAVPQMRAQAKTDGASYVRVGGPATASLPSNWIPALLSDATISQNIDFVSYHDYMFNNHELSAQWNTLVNGIPSVYQRTQNSGASPMSQYLLATRMVAAGKQPQGRSLPIYNTEYNVNYTLNAKDCCRNDYTYSPVWNGMYVADLLNAVYSGAPNVISRLTYFAAATTTKDYFCLIGVRDANMDCSLTGGAVLPYPQYYLYQLFGSPSYLGLQNGGSMAKSISPGTRGNGLIVTAFYTSGADSIVIINPSGNTYDNLTVSAANTALSSPAGTLFTIVNGQSIKSSSVSLASQGGTSYGTTITVGPYSVQAISLHH